MDDIIYYAPDIVKIQYGRWGIIITIDKEDGITDEYVASADLAFTDGSGIWFGTKDEYYNELVNKC